MPFRSRPFLAVLAGGAIAAPLTGTALAQRWGGPGWGPGWGSGYGSPYGGPMRDGPDRSREGKISVARFVSQAPLAAQLGHGAILVSSLSPEALDLGHTNRTYEAAVRERLAKAGYGIVPSPDAAQMQAQPVADQIAELTVTRTELEPPEPPHKPVSGEAGMEVGNRGSGFSLAVNVDLRKPLPPLIKTRLEARIRDRATNAILWEGRAEVATRPGTKGWNDQQTAARLAAALLDGFPRASDKVSPRGG